MKSRNYLLAIAVVCTISLTACNRNTDTPAAPAPAVSTSPYAAYAGDWLTEVYTGDSAEPALVVMIKGSDSADGWSTKFTHLDDPVPSSARIVGDTLVTESGSFASGLREGRTVETVTSYLHRNGDELTGRFVATYDDGEVVHGRMQGERVE